MMIAIVVSLLYLIYMRKSLLDLSCTLDHEAFTPSDFCMIGRNMEFEDFSPASIEAEIR